MIDMEIIRERRIEWLEWHYEGLARAECKRQGVNPDEIICDSGKLTWQMIGHEVAEKEMKERK